MISRGFEEGMSAKMKVADQMRDRLQAAFAPRELEIVNDSGRHAGHSGDDGTGESHFSIRIRADAFAPMGRVERHRAVHGALGRDITATVHAIALDIAG